MKRSIYESKIYTYIGKLILSSYCLNHADKQSYSTFLPLLDFKGTLTEI